MKNPLATLLLILCVIFGAGWFFSARQASARQAALEALGDSTARLELEKAGYVSAFAAVRDGLLAQADSAKALENALRRSESRRYARTEIVTEVHVDTVVAATADSSATFFSAEIDRDPVYGRLTFDLPKREFGYDLRVAPRVEQYIVQSASDQLLIGVRALSPATTVRVEAFDATPYLRRTSQISFWDKVKYIAIGAVSGAAAWEFAR